MRIFFGYLLFLTVDRALGVIAQYIDSDDKEDIVRSLKCFEELLITHISVTTESLPDPPSSYD